MGAKQDKRSALSPTHSHVPIGAPEEAVLAEQAALRREVQPREGISLHRQRGAAAGLGTEPQGHHGATRCHDPSSGTSCGTGAVLGGSSSRRAEQSPAPSSSPRTGMGKQRLCPYLCGSTGKRGKSWHYILELQGAEPNPPN